jgi:imidazole glycerol-phosphate synthase subunit HisH
MICIVDYGVGNIQAFINSFKRLGVDVKRVSTPENILGAEKLVLPGVGHFDHAMSRLNDSGLRHKLEDLVLGHKVPVLGVCVGMQILANGSEEGTLPGLGWIPGRVKIFPENLLGTNLPLPHMGWNDLQTNADNFLFSKGFEGSSQFYFLHSYYFEAQDKIDVIATANYGFDFDAAVSRENIHGVQFHPEKSHRWGEQLLKNFLEF